MRSQILTAVWVFSLTVLLILPAAAQSKEEWRLCKVAEYNTRITACTRIIEKYSNRADVASRAYAYRSEAYKELGKKSFSRETAELGTKDLE